jgi:adenosylmethionine-8-amino-7-oxononanoate aminotransferase
MSLGGKPEDRPGFDFNEEVVEHVSAPYPYRRPEGTTLEEFCDMLVEELEQKILELGPENVAGFFAEPIMGAGGVIVPPPGYHQRTQEVCRRYGVLTVSDEVVTGFGRLGHMFASEPMFGLDPDIIVCAKGISSGYIPLGGAIISDEIYEVLADPAVEGAFSHGYTYSGHPIACVAALKNIEIIERDDICGHVREVGPHLEEQLATLSDLPLVGDVRGSHFMMCVENVADKETKELLPESVNIGKRIADHCEERGVFVRPVDHLNVISPPLILTRDQIETIAGTLRESILATMDDLVREGLWKGR